MYIILYIYVNMYIYICPQDRKNDTVLRDVSLYSFF